MPGLRRIRAHRRRHRGTVTGWELLPQEGDTLPIKVEVTGGRQPIVIKARAGDGYWNRVRQTLDRVHGYTDPGNNLPTD